MHVPSGPFFTSSHWALHRTLQVIRLNFSQHLLSAGLESQRLQVYHGLSVCVLFPTATDLLQAPFPCIQLDAEIGPTPLASEGKREDRSLDRSSSQPLKVTPNNDPQSLFNGSVIKALWMIGLMIKHDKTIKIRIIDQFYSLLLMIKPSCFLFISGWFLRMCFWGYWLK